MSLAARVSWVLNVECWMSNVFRHLGRVGLAALLPALSVLSASAADPAAAFDAANRLYAQGKFAAAAAAYEKIIADGPASTALHFNLGNAAFKSGQMGRAIVAYRKAQQLAPRDPDVQANLRFARNQVSGSDPARLNLLPRLLGRFTLNEWTTFASLALWAWLILLGLREWKPAQRQTLRGYTLWIGVAAGLLAAGTTMALLVNPSANSAVVVAKDTPVKAGPLDDSQNTFVARDGAELTVLDEKDDWYQVTDGRNRLGWVKRDAVRVL
jgi:tetratricopeptide (TPR) repeat protein